jgi:hypothetical protein
MRIGTEARVSLPESTGESSSSHRLRDLPLTVPSRAPPDPEQTPGEAALIPLVGCMTPCRSNWGASILGWNIVPFIDRTTIAQNSSPASRLNSTSGPPRRNLSQLHRYSVTGIASISSVVRNTRTRLKGRLHSLQSIVPRHHALQMVPNAPSRHSPAAPAASNPAGSAGIIGPQPAVSGLIEHGFSLTHSAWHVERCPRRRLSRTTCPYSAASP